MIKRNKNGKFMIKHGCGRNGKETPTYRSWTHMLNRCRDKKQKNYNGRGISVCKRWLRFENFLEDMGERPNNMTLDRVNNNKNYCPSNCRWATWTMQERNRKNNRLLAFNKETHCVTEWAEILGINRNIIYSRLDRLNWSIEKTLTISVKHYNRKVVKE